MSKKKFTAVVLCVVLLAIVNIVIFRYEPPVRGEAALSMKVNASEANQAIQVYQTETDADFTEENSQISTMTQKTSQMTWKISVFSKKLRIDFGKTAGVQFTVADCTISYAGERIVLSMQSFLEAERQQIERIEKTADGFCFTTAGEDSGIVISLDLSDFQQKAKESGRTKQLLQNIFFMAVIDGMAVLAFLLRKKIMPLPCELYQNRKLIWSLAKNDFKTKYAGSYLGIIWAFVQPIVTILVYCFVFTIGLRSGNVSGYPFVLYLISGMVPWLFFQDALNGGTNALLEYNYLVKKVVFKISILPIVKLMSAIFVHLFFIAFALIIFSIYGYTPTPYTLQILYYTICIFMFSLGLVYASSAIVIFFRDLTQIINIVLQVGVWMTPIMWDINMLKGHPALMKLFTLNPIYYVVSGYRDSLLNQVGILGHWKWMIYFWVVTAILFLVGTTIFKRLKVHFADVL